MPEFTREELRDVMHAIRHYQIYHVSIKNPRYEDYNAILEKLEKTVSNLPETPQEKYVRQQFLLWLETQQNQNKDT